MNISYRTKLSRILTNPAVLRSTVVESMRLSRPIMVGEYQREAPVDKGLLRNKVHATGVWDTASNIYYDVMSLANNRGFRYPVAVAMGTGIFKGVNKDYPSTGRLRAGENNKGVGGIRPNMFHRRAKGAAEPKIIKFISIRLDKEIAKTVKTND